MTRKRYIVALAVSILLLALLFTYADIDLREVVTLILETDPLALIVCFVLVGIGYYLRAIRFALLLQTPIDTTTLLHTVSIQNLLVNTTPARVGDFSLLYLLKKKRNVSAAESASALVVARVLDFTAIMAYFIAALFFLPALPDVIEAAIPLITAFIIALNLALLILVFQGKHAVAKLTSMLSSLGYADQKLVAFILDKASTVADGVAQLRSKRLAAYLFILSLTQWASIHATSYLLITGMGFAIPLSIIIVAATFSMFSAFLPIQGLAGFGTMEGVWALVLIPFGIGKDDAMLSGLNFHIIYLVYLLIYGALSMWQLSLKRLPKQNVKGEKYLPPATQQ